MAGSGVFSKSETCPNCKQRIVHHCGAMTQPSPSPDQPRHQEGVDWTLMARVIQNLVYDEGHGWPKSAVGLDGFIAGIAAEYARLQEQRQP